LLAQPLPRHAAQLADPRLAQRGNQPVRTTLILQLQRTAGNRATRRLLQHAARTAGETALTESPAPAPEAAPAAPAETASQRPPAPAPVQRAVSFTLKEVGGAGMLGRRIVQVNPGSRSDAGFIDNRVQHLQCNDNEDRRHIIGHDLIARGLKNLVKGHTVQQTYTWLQQATSWVDQANAGADMAFAGQSVAGVESGLTRWLRNATSYGPNLFCGPRKVNVRKGARVPHKAREVKEAWYSGAINQASVTSINSMDKKSGQETVYFLGGRFLRGAINLQDPNLDIRLRRALGSNLLRSIPGSVIELTVNGQPPVRGGAFMFNNGQVSRVSRARREIVTRGPQLEAARQGFLANQVDLDERQNYTLHYGPTLAGSLQVTDFTNTVVHLGEVGLGDKYTPQNMPPADYHRQDDLAKVQTMRVSGGGGGMPPAPRGRGPRGIPHRVVQRRVSLGLEDARPNVMGEPIVSINPGDRPPLYTSRFPTAKGQARRHRVGYDLIADALRRVLKNVTVNQAAAWLDYLPNWVDQGHADQDRAPYLDQGKVIRALGAVEAMAGQWLMNATNAPSNLFLGNPDINLRKGTAVTGLRRQVKEAAHWGNIGNLLQVQSISAIDRVTDAPVNFLQDGVATANLDQATLLGAAVGGTFLRADPGTWLVLLLPNHTRAYWGAAYAYMVRAGHNAQFYIKRVSRSYNHAAYLDEPTRQQAAENARIGFMANEIDVQEPAPGQPYNTPYEPYYANMSLVRPEDVSDYEGMIQKVNAELAGKSGPMRHTPQHVPSRGQYERQPAAPPQLTVERLSRLLAVYWQPGNQQPQRADYEHALTGPPARLDPRGAQHLVAAVFQFWNHCFGQQPPQPIKGMAEWAAGSKYRPQGQIPPNIHQAADQGSLEKTQGKQDYTNWVQRNRPWPPPPPGLLTRLLKAQDVQIFLDQYAPSVTFTDRQVKWIVKEGLHKQANGQSQVAFEAKLNSGNLQTVAGRQQTIINVFQAALAAQTVRFPTRW
jgi:hypothetical protein